MLRSSQTAPAWPAGACALLAAAAYIYWVARFFCPEGYMLHPPYPPWQVAVGRLVPVLLIAACVLALRARAVAPGFVALACLAMLGCWAMETVFPLGLAAYCPRLPARLLLLLSFLNLTPLPRLLKGRPAAARMLDLVLVVVLEIGFLSAMVRETKCLELTSLALLLAPLAVYALIMADGTLCAVQILRDRANGRDETIPDNP